MWPRGDEPGAEGPGRRSKSGGLSGFVSFKRRKDAEHALKKLDGADWGGSVLRVGWSKSVPTSGRVIYGAFENRRLSKPWSYAVQDVSHLALVQDHRLLIESAVTTSQGQGQETDARHPGRAREVETVGIRGAVHADLSLETVSAVMVRAIVTAPASLAKS